MGCEKRWGRCGVDQVGRELVVREARDVNTKAGAHVGQMGAKSAAMGPSLEALCPDLQQDSALSLRAGPRCACFVLHPIHDGPLRSLVSYLC